jgi:hypothetical protein
MYELLLTHRGHDHGGVNFEVLSRPSEVQLCIELTVAPMSGIVPMNPIPNLVIIVEEYVVQKGK